MSENNVKVTIHFPSLGKKVKTDTNTIQQLAKDLKNKRKRKKLLDLAKPTEVEEKDHDEEWKNARDAYSGEREEE